LSDCGGAAENVEIERDAASYAQEQPHAELHVVLRIYGVNRKHQLRPVAALDEVGALARHQAEVANRCRKECVRAEQQAVV